MPAGPRVNPASFRDPSGFVFEYQGETYRQINLSYRENYRRLMRSGLYESLVRDGLLIPHVEADPELGRGAAAYKVIRPEPISFVSYPYEWCFSELKQAARLTLRVERRALAVGMTLKDASAYNVQFRNGEPVLIDTLSFENYREGEPWSAYRQFCQHFLAPLAVMGYVDIRLRRLSRPFLDGLPLDLASSMLPFRTRLRPALLSHLHLHATAQARIKSRQGLLKRISLSQTGMLGLVDSLEGAVEALNWRPRATPWLNYAAVCDYSPAALSDKRLAVGEWLDRLRPGRQSLWDLGANVGTFSRLASDRGFQTIAFDEDEGAVEENYLNVVSLRERTLLPLVMDLTNPSPREGWACEERMSWIDRGPVDVVLALALVHHLVLSNNLSFRQLAELLSRLCRFLIVEFVPREDPQVKRLMQGREDAFPEYDGQSFLNAFGDWFTIESRRAVVDTARTLYLMARRGE